MFLNKWKQKYRNASDDKVKRQMHKNKTQQNDGYQNNHTSRSRILPLILSLPNQRSHYWGRHRTQCGGSAARSQPRRLPDGILAVTYHVVLCLFPRPSTLTSVIIKGKLLLHVFQKSQTHSRGHNLDRVIPSISWFPIFCFPTKDHNHTK